ncbi:JAB domain-containing protein [Rhodovastum atsumiense]|nr:JAB domain-containing protein [Rhodovastum atsumiense]
MIGTQAVPAIVRASASSGPSSLQVTGLPEGSATPLGRHVIAVLSRCGVDVTGALIIDVRPPRTEAGAGLDLAVALALLVANGTIGQDRLADVVAAGGLASDGGLEPIDDMDAVAIQAAARGLLLFCPDGQAEAAAAAGHGHVIGAQGLAAVVAYLSDQQFLPPWQQGDGVAPPRWGGLAERAAPAIRPVMLPVSADGIIQPPAPASAAVASPVFPGTGPQGHRNRMREKVLIRGTDALADYELLEMLLFLAFARGDTKPLAKRMINAFGSYAGVLSASPEALLATPGVNDHAATAIAVVRASAERLARAGVADLPVLNNWDRLMAYLNVTMAHAPVEQLRVLFLDTRNRLIADEVQARGTVNHTPVYPREVVRRALELHATALILVHNHPSGDPTPSQDDIAMTQEVRVAAGAMSIVLHDHVIIGKGSWCSLKKERLL